MRLSGCGKDDHSAREKALDPDEKMITTME
jgi:hypothetical protein